MVVNQVVLLWQADDSQILLPLLALGWILIVAQHCPLIGVVVHRIELVGYVP